MTRRLGVVGRADRGGIAAQTLSVAQHLHADVALIVDMRERGRGELDLKPWRKATKEHHVCLDPPDDQALAWFLDRCDVVYAAEAPLAGARRADEFPQMCTDRDVELFIHVNPELWKQHYRAATTRLVLPTEWHQDRFPDATLLPMPVDRKQFPYRHRDEARGFFFLGAPAMADRAGLQLLKAALDHVRTPTRLVSRGCTNYALEACVGNVEILDMPPVAKHAEVYPPGVDVLVAPRRYGGLSLPFLEAASLGMPIITLNLPPQNGWMPPEQLVTTLEPPMRSAMIGGEELVYDARPEALAERIDLFAGDPELVARCSKEMDAWASVRSWDVLAPLWRMELGL